MKVKVDKDLCIGCGACQAICSDVFEIVDGLSSVLVDEVQEEYQDDTREAIESCPTEAIKEVK